jgi:hypothetical protein
MAWDMEEKGMKRLTLFTTACVLAILAALGTQLRAQNIDTNERTFITFKTAVELPGVTLEPGEYEFRLAETQQRNVVQVLRREDMKPMGQFTFASSERERTTDETMVMFKEAREGTTPAVQYWYFPNQKIGKEFIYPKEQAQKIAARTSQTVRSEEGPVTAATADANPAPPAIPQTASDSPRPVSTQAEAAAVTSSDTAADAARRNGPASSQPTAAAGSLTGNRGIAQTAPVESAANADTDAAANRDRVEPAPIAQEPARVETTARAEAAPQSEPRPVGTSGIAQDREPADQAARNDQLPATASPLPLSALIGLLSLAGAAGLRALRA